MKRFKSCQCSSNLSTFSAETSQDWLEVGEQKVLFSSLHPFTFIPCRWINTKCLLSVVLWLLHSQIFLTTTHYNESIRQTWFSGEEQLNQLEVHSGGNIYCSYSSSVDVPVAVCDSVTEIKTFQSHVLHLLPFFNICIDVLQMFCLFCFLVV